MKVYATKSFGFEAAHNLLNYDGACSQLHGHSYKLDVTVSGSVNEICHNGELATEAMVLDFKDLKSIVKENVVDVYDHQYLNDFFTQPTAEAMVISFFCTIEKKLPHYVKLESVKLWETADSFAECKGERK